MTRLCLFFSGGRRPKLYRTEFWIGDECFVTVRGASSDASGKIGAFQWTKGVRALSLLAVITTLAKYDRTIAPRLEGARSSPAAWLDGVLSKEPVWIIHMFGKHVGGAPAVRRLFARSNPGGKRPGAVAVSFAPSILYGLIEVFLDGKRLEGTENLQVLLRELSSSSIRI